MDNNEIFQLSYGLIQKINTIEDYDEKDIMYNHKRFSKDPAFTKFIQYHFALYKAILSKSVTMNNLYILLQMLEQRKNIQTGELGTSDATDSVSKLLSHQFNCNWQNLDNNKKKKQKRKNTNKNTSKKNNKK